MNQGKKQKLIDTAIALVAEKGLDSTSVTAVAKTAGTSERLVYHHFGTKENLVQVCYKQVSQSLSERLSECVIDDNAPPEELVKDFWLNFFRCLVQSGDQALFLYEYGRSSFSQQNGIARFEGIERFAEIFHRLDQKYHILEQVDGACLQAYILDNTTLFACRVLRGGLSNTQEVRDSLWKLLAHGVLGLMQ